MHRYRILPRRRGREYVLDENGAVLGTLTLKAWHQNSAAITAGTMEIDLTRKAAFRKHVHLKHPKHEIRFTADALSRGVLAIDDHVYEWVPANIRWTEWVWRHAGRTFLAVHLKENIGSPRGVVSSEKELHTDHDILLALFGWYLMLLNHQNFGMHLLHAVAFATAKDR